MQITEATVLKELPLPHLEVILDEVFLIPPSWLFSELEVPRTAGNLAHQTGLGFAEVATRLKRLMRLAAGIEVSPHELPLLLAEQEPPSAEITCDPERLILLDVRDQGEMIAGLLPGATVLKRGVDFSLLLPRLQAAQQLIVVCQDGRRSFSAAMFLRQNGVTQARFLTGGLANYRASDNFRWI